MEQVMDTLSEFALMGIIGSSVITIAVAWSGRWPSELKIAPLQSSPHSLNPQPKFAATSRVDSQPIAGESHSAVRRRVSAERGKSPLTGKEGRGAVPLHAAMPPAGERVAAGAYRRLDPITALPSTAVEDAAAEDASGMAQTGADAVHNTAWLAGALLALHLAATARGSGGIVLPWARGIGTSITSVVLGSMATRYAFKSWSVETSRAWADSRFTGDGSVSAVGQGGNMGGAASTKAGIKTRVLRAIAAAPGASAATAATATATAAASIALPGQMRGAFAFAAALHALYWPFLRRAGGLWRGAASGCVTVLTVDAALSLVGEHLALAKAATVVGWFVLADMREDASRQGSHVRTLRNSHPPSFTAFLAAILHANLLVALSRARGFSSPVVAIHATAAVADVVSLLRSDQEGKTTAESSVGTQQWLGVARRILTGVWPFFLLRWMAGGVGSVGIPPLLSQAFASVPFLALFIVAGVYTSEYNSLLGDRSSRKALHIGIGSLLLALQPPRGVVAGFGAAVMVAQVLSGVFDIKLRFARNSFDLGMFEYALLLTLCAASGLPWNVLAPAFFADPLAMLVGSRVKSRKWYANKSVAGSIAAFVATVVCMGGSIPGRLLAGALVTLAEAFGGRHDNICVGLCCLAVGFLRKSNLYL